MVREQKIRALLFYLSVLVFFTGLPPILSSTLGYKFDRRTFKFTKTGLIALKTQPPGARIYLGRKLLPLKTPATINELLPGAYSLRLELEDHFPWSGEVEVQANRVTRLEKIILFPLLPQVKQVNKEKFSSFVVDEEKGVLYYIDATEGRVYRSDLEGEGFKRVADFNRLPEEAFRWKLSPDRTKLLYFNARTIGIVYLDSAFSLQTDFSLNYRGGGILDVFWHSDSYHLIVVGDRKVEALEAQPYALPVALVGLNKKNTQAFYHTGSDVLYFLDSQKAPDGNYYDNLYQLDLGKRLFALPEFMRRKTDE